jgi:ABC-2 type transport system ATP-binding protein
MKVEVVNLKKYFGATHAVDDISFSFAAGEVIGFVGPNGAGKTTTMRVLATLEEPTSGDAFVNGVSVIQEPEVARRMIGYVPDALPTHRDISVRDYLDFFARAYGIKGERRREVTQRVEEFTGLSGIREKMLNALSKGMKQRVSVARALLHDPPVLIMDEPAAGLDPRARVELRELVRELAGLGKAILISSHILTELAEICSGAVIIEHGNLLMAGTMTELFSQSVPRRRVFIRTAGQHDELIRELLQMPGVEESHPAGGEIVAVIDGTEDVCAEVLATLVKRGYRISEFRHQRADLEDIFMRVTTGEVQ